LDKSELKQSVSTAVTQSNQLANANCFTRISIHVFYASEALKISSTGLRVRKDSCFIRNYLLSALLLCQSVVNFVGPKTMFKINYHKHMSANPTET